VRVLWGDFKVAKRRNQPIHGIEQCQFWLSCSIELKYALFLLFLRSTCMLVRFVFFITFHDS
jgi:hypothetical protein